MNTQQTTGYFREQFPAMAEALRKSTATPAQAHSPLPWKVYHLPKGHATGNGNLEIQSGELTLVANIPTEGDNPRGFRARKANAAFIVRACNEYENLNDKLQVAHATIDYYEKRELERIKETGDAKAHAQRLADALKGVQWKIQAYGSRWEPSQAERESIAEALAKWEGDNQ